MNSDKYNVELANDRILRELPVCTTKVNKMKTQTEKDRAIKKVEIAIDKMVDLQDAGFGCDETARILEMLNRLRGNIETQ